MSVPVYQCDAIRAIFERLVLHVERKLEAVGCISATLRGAHVPERRTGAPRRDVGQMPSCRVYLGRLGPKSSAGVAEKYSSGRDQ